jgi:hypothetical protein
LVFFSGCSEATKAQVAPKVVKAPQKYQLKVVRVDKKVVQDSDVFSVDFQTIKKISKLKSAKKLSSEDRVLQLLKKLNIKESLNLKSINSNTKAMKQTKNEIVVAGYSPYLYDGYVLYFDKDSLDIKRATIFKDKRVFDISNDMKKVLVVENKGGNRHIKTYVFSTSKFQDIKVIPNEITSLKFSPKESYVVKVSEFELSGKKNSSLAVYDSKTSKRLLLELAHSVNDWEAEFKFTFSPNEKYLFTSESGLGSKDRRANLYTTSNFSSVLSLSEEKEDDFEFGWGNFMLTDDYLVLVSKKEIYSLKTKKTIDKIHFDFSSPNIMDKKDNRLFYAIGTKKIGIYYIKDDLTYLIKKISKEENFPKDAFIYNDKLYLSPSYKTKFQIIDISNLGIENYNFELTKQLKQAKKFYNAGFKAKSLAMYKKMVSNKDFSKYFNIPRYWEFMAIHSSVNLQKYKINGDVNSLSQYIIDALNYDYINEATKALRELKTTDKKELHVVLNAMLLAQIGKEQEAYDDLVERMPFSQKIKDMVEKNSNSYLKLYKDKAKVSLIFGIDESKIKYDKLEKSVDFVSFDGHLIDAKSKTTKKIKTQEVATPKQNAIQLLD